METGVRKCTILREIIYECSRIRKMEIWLFNHFLSAGDFQDLVGLKVDKCCLILQVFWLTFSKQHNTCLFRHLWTKKCYIYSRNTINVLSVRNKDQWLIVLCHRPLQLKNYKRALYFRSKKYFNTNSSAATFLYGTDKEVRCNMTNML